MAEVAEAEEAAPMPDVGEPAVAAFAGGAPVRPTRPAVSAPAVGVVRGTRPAASEALAAPPR
ncbi:MAG: hypothetical protein WKG00_08970 [Polyangiaceae bacterium]